MNGQRLNLSFVLIAIVCTGCASTPPSPGEYWKETIHFNYENSRSRSGSLKVCLPVNANIKERILYAFSHARKNNKDSDNNGCETIITKSTAQKTEWKIQCHGTRDGMVGMDTDMRGSIVGTDKKYTMTTYMHAKMSSVFYESKTNNGFGVGGQTSDWEYLGGSCDSKKDKPVRLKE